MLPMAFNSDGDPFELPAAAVGWRVKRYQSGRGAPELVYNAGGLPLVLPLEAGIDELRRAVVTPGKYRLDPLDGQRRPEPPTANAVPRASWPGGTDPNANPMLIEALRINAEIARTVAGRFGALVEAAASLLRAANGAAPPRHQPIQAEHDDGEAHTADDHDDERQADVYDDDENAQGAGPATRPSGMDVNALISQLAAVLLGPRQPAPEAPPAAAAAPPPQSESPASEPSVSAPGHQPQEPPAVAAVTKPPPVAGPQPSTPRNATAMPASARRSPAKPSRTGSPQVTWLAPFPSTDLEPPPLSTDVVLHFVAILRALRRNEAALVGAAADELSVSDLRTWLEDLSLMAIPEAVVYMRELIAGSNRWRSVS